MVNRSTVKYLNCEFLTHDCQYIVPRYLNDILKLLLYFYNKISFLCIQNNGSDQAKWAIVS